MDITEKIDKVLNEGAGDLKLLKVIRKLTHPSSSHAIGDSSFNRELRNELSYFFEEKGYEELAASYLAEEIISDLGKIIATALTQQAKRLAKG